MTKTVKPTLANLKRLVASLGGTVEADGMGGYEIFAPEGRIWTDLEVWGQPLPLNEYDTAEERAELIESIMGLLAAGHEPY